MFRPLKLLWYSVPCVGYGASLTAQVTVFTSAEWQDSKTRYYDNKTHLGCRNQARTGLRILFLLAMFQNARWSYAGCRRRSTNGIIQYWTLNVTGSTCQVTCAHGHISGMMVVRATNCLLIRFKACSKEGKWTWYCKSVLIRVKPMAKEIIGSSKGAM